MTLLDYIADPARRQSLAAAVNRNPDYLWQVAKGYQRTSGVVVRASVRLAIEIESATKGAVSRESLRPDVWGHVSKKKH